MLPTVTYQESPKAAAAYAQYEAMGEERSLDKLARLLNPTKTRPNLAQLKVWSAKYAWQDRVAVADAARLERERVERERAQAQEAKRRAEHEARRAVREMDQAEARWRMDDERAPAMRAAWLRTWDRINERVKNDETRGLVGLVALLKHAMDEERLCRGGATAVQEQRLSGEAGYTVTFVLPEILNEPHDALEPQVIIDAASFPAPDDSD